MIDNVSFLCYNFLRKLFKKETKMKVSDKFGVTKEEFEAIKNEAERLEKMGYKVPDITIAPIANSAGNQGFSTFNHIIIHPHLDIEYLKFVVRHEIGHQNDNETEANIWADDPIADLENRMEDFANNFARKTR